ncbi:DUF4240 domain-containing protein [Streptomyces clavuligerus]|uniref:DUF4240 domain-containing protein n=1 Tax=Streptomyces clavuligerus TaxID=1901 RepID=B5H096_STRCL|nr:DUF4240 domain-containing protein [Streptomyces clavuligerus]ANW21441.1 hypothetical protein BB341_26135 [Streptomyces clavuligerus]AXU16074.1 DUF4240 domain-containing protein [Streptomyces clavuligerus]EDY51992.1 conserved hypothetical protein [Streptomyces clavuligerus]EFG05404.1 Hypothetical protein SCLAV_0328 [Streptomyces clavuligerus]MBY6306211.1 DUF4240 domain-containing protein [Streptomyces clavuligerus]
MTMDIAAAHETLPLDDFWQLIDAARERATEERPFAQALTDILADCPPQTILAYERTFTDVHERLYRWDVWAAAFLIGGGCSDDSFMDFRAGVISQGREWYERVLASPDSLARHPLALDGDPGHLENLFDERVNYAAAKAYPRALGDPEAWDAMVAEGYDADEPEEDTMGEAFDFGDEREMRRRLPSLTVLIADGEDRP